MINRLMKSIELLIRDVGADGAEQVIDEIFLNSGGIESVSELVEALEEEHSYMADAQK